MPYGMTVYNTTNNLVIDNTYQNMGLKNKVSFSLGGGGTQTISLSGAVAPLLFINSSGYVGIMNFSVSGSTATWTLVAASSSTGAAYVFDQGLTTASGYGMRVLDSAGNDVFNSSNKYLRVVETYSVSYSATSLGVSGPTVTRSYGASTYAACISQPRVEIVSGAGGNTVITDAINTSSTSVSIAHNLSQSYPFGTVITDHTGLYFGSGTVPAMTIDVTGY
jgi:hypothetical protein